MQNIIVPGNTVLENREETAGKLDDRELLDSNDRRRRVIDYINEELSSSEERPSEWGTHVTPKVDQRVG